MVKYAFLLPILAGLIGAANAHSLVYSLWVNGVDQGDGRGTYIRSPPNNDPVKDLSKKDIICNVNNRVVPKSVTANAGDEITFEWYHDNRGDDIVAESHRGPITVYIADAATNGAGNVWTKIAETGWSKGVWAVDTIRANGGKYSMTLPASLAPGDYLLRSEIIALHEGDTNYLSNQARGAQFYPSCSQLTVAKGGHDSPPGTFSFFGGYTPTDPGILFDLYNGFTSYPIPGPPVWAGGAGSTKVASTPTYVTPMDTPTSTPTYVTPMDTPTSTPTYATPVDIPTTTPTYVPPVDTPTKIPTYVTPMVTPTPTRTTLCTRTRTPTRTRTRKACAAHPRRTHTPKP